MKKQEKVEFNLFGESKVEIEQFISDNGEQLFRVFWSDGVANEWKEYYSNFSTALLRVSLLANCVELETMLSDSVDTFIADALKFVQEHTKG